MPPSRRLPHGVRAALAALAALAGGCTGQADGGQANGEQAGAQAPQAAPGEASRAHRPPEGSNAVFDEALSAAPGHRLIAADLVLPPEAEGPAHSHPWEEYLYVIEGSAELDVAGMEPRVLEAGERFVIPARTVHIPRAGPEGIRAMVLRVHREGDPLSIPAP